MQNVSDIRSNANDQFVYAANKLNRSELKKKVFRAIYYGKQKIKTVEYIAKQTGLSRKKVLDNAKKLETDKLIHQIKHKKDTAYTKDDAYKGVWKAVLKKAGNKKKLEKIATKTNPKGSNAKIINIRVPQRLAKIQQITVDDISSFEKVKKIKTSTVSLAKMSETKFKKGVLKILGETGPPPKDWGGEKNDIYTTKLKIGGKRYHAAIALKGPGKKKKRLMQKDMGKNGDQIQRLNRSSAQVFLVQYWREIDQSVIDLMNDLFVGKAYSEGRTIYFGIINGNDSSRLVQAYKGSFK